MSVSLMIEIENTHEWQEIPVSTNKSFEDHWVPICNRLGLKWVPAFIGGFEVEAEYIKEIIGELDEIRAYIRGESLNSPPQQLMMERISRLTLVLDDLALNPNRKAFF